MITNISSDTDQHNICNDTKKNIIATLTPCHEHKRHDRYEMLRLQENMYCNIDGGSILPSSQKPTNVARSLITKASNWANADTLDNIVPASWTHANNQV